jgi:type I restriction enzyme R subunit
MTFDSREAHQSQIPAIQLLVALGFKPLSQSEALRLRGGRLSNVVLDDVVVENVMRINRFTHRGQAYAFDLGDAHEALRRLKPAPDQVKGLRHTNQMVYDTLVLGTTITKVIDGDSKSYSLQFIDWQNPANNTFHVTAEYTVERSGPGDRTRRCDIVAFVNGIPFVVIENKRPTEALKRADSQLLGYQHEDGIPQLFHFAQLLLSMNRVDARYATVGTPQKFWSIWRDEEGTDEQVAQAANEALTPAEQDSVFSGDFAAARPYFESMAGEGERLVTVQDRTIYSLCRPERLLDIVRRFTVFDGGFRKVARHQQFFGLRHAMERVAQFEPSGARKGGVIWHTQGSGKSLTMVMLGRALAMEASIPNPRIVIVTDRDDLDKQIRDTFKSCELEPVRASSGSHLLTLIADKKPLVTTIINKFETALRHAKTADPDANIFVLVDESHRTQTGHSGGLGQFAGKMRRLLPNACYLGFTGTPLLKKDKNTLHTFGGLIHRYAIEDAVADGAVVPLLYEGRLVEQQVSGKVIDRWFDMISTDLSELQKADLKRKFSRMDSLSRTSQAVQAKAFDISEHYRAHWQGTQFKAQLVAPSKAAAIRFKQALDELGQVSSAVIISAPNDHEGNDDVDKPSKDLVQAFWAQMMAKYGGEESYNKSIIDAFKGSGDPEILIVVSKLLTGFDAPRNAILYVCKPLREHNLLQAIARVNRLFEENGTEKQFGYVIDYEGLLGELDNAFTTYGAFAGYDPADVAGALRGIQEEIRKLEPSHEQLWEVFKTVRNKKDMEAFEQLLADEGQRQEFYARYSVFSRRLHVSLSSMKLSETFSDTQVDRFKHDWKMFAELKRSVQRRYQETVSLSEYEPKIAKLLDDHVTAMPAEIIIEMVNIHDPEALRAVVNEVGPTPGSKADRIASATRRTITEKLDEDPAFYVPFSEMLEQTIYDYRERRISERDYLNRVLDLSNRVAQKQPRREVPAAIRADGDAIALFGLLDGRLVRSDGAVLSVEEEAAAAKDIMDIVRSHLIVGIWSNEGAQNRLRNAIDDYFFDRLRGELNVDITIEQMDELQQRVLGLSRARFTS